MTDTELNEHLIADYKAHYYQYEHMYDYYIGNHDIYTELTNLSGKCNKKVVNNFVKKFINEEINYTLGNALSYVSKSGNSDIIKAVDNNLYHWELNHNSDVMRELEIYGKVYLLNYIDSKGRFCERILTPKNAIAYVDDNDKITRFIHFYKKKYDEAEWYDVYYSNGTIETYKGSTLVKTSEQYFNNIPVSVCQMKDIHDTIYYKIKTLQDAYNLILSTQVCTIADYRNAYLVIKGARIDEEAIEQLQKDDIMPLSKDANAEWLIKNLDSTSINNALTELKYDMYVACNHIDGNEELSSNTSGAALRSRLVFLEQIAKSIYKLVEDAIYDRLERLFEYLQLHNNISYDVKDIVINFTPNIPQDETTTIQNVIQLGDLVSHETKLKLLPFIENPIDELAKIKAEKDADNSADIDKLVELMSNSGADNAG